MQKYGWLLGTVVVGGIAIALWKTAKSLDKLEVGVSSIDYDSKASKLLEFARFKLKIGVYNPNSRPVKFKGFTGNLYYKGSRIANIDPITSGYNIQFTPRKTTTIPIQVDVPTTKIATNFLDLLEEMILKNKKKEPKVVTLEGFIEAESMKIPFTYNIDLTQI